MLKSGQNCPMCNHLQSDLSDSRRRRPFAQHAKLFTRIVSVFVADPNGGLAIIDLYPSMCI